MRRSVLLAGLGGTILFAACSDPIKYNPGTDAGHDAGVDAPVLSNDDASLVTDTGAGDGSTCVPNVANFEIPDNGCDDDSDGTIDNVPTCDDGLDPASEAGDYVKSLGLCQEAVGGKWGVVSAEFSQGYGGTGGIADGQHGILPQFGLVVKPREGTMLGVLSTGYAREWDDAVLDNCPTCQFKGHSGIQIGNPPTGIVNGAPPGYPKAAMGCPNTNSVFDAVALKIQLQVPHNAKGFQFDFDFYSGEWPEYVCTEKNDSFIVYYKSAAFNDGEPENVSFDSAGNPVSVNNAFFDRCTPHTSCPSKSDLGECPGGTDELEGTGFYKLGNYCNTQSTAGGATGWLTTQAPVVPGETIELDFIIWDTGDAVWDSSVLLDNFKWIPSEVTTPGTTRPPQ